MKGNFKATTALALIDNTKVAAPAVKKFATAVATQFHEIARSERTNARRAVLVGLALSIVKNSLPHGEFRRWLLANVTRSNIWTEATAIKNASLYSRLAIAFLEKSKPDAKELLTLTSGSPDTWLGGPLDVSGNKFITRVDKFCADKTIAELLDQHVHGKGKGDDDSEESNNAPAIPADDNTLLQDFAEWMTNIRKTVTDPETLKRFTPSAITALERQLESTVEDFRKAKESLRKE